jgi:hypothetical protein
MLVTHKDGLPLTAPYFADVVPMLPGERYDVILEMDNPGLWINHDHIEAHVSNAGKAPGGAVFIIEYDEIDQPDWYVWKNKPGDPDFYLSESLAADYGIFNTAAFQGKVPVDDAKPRKKKKKKKDKKKSDSQ